jgi:hypothetical protein
MRTVLAAALLLLGSACSFSPDGTCSSDGQCGAGRICANGVCAGCDRDADCHAWQSCAVATRTCGLAAGHCNVDAECQLWQACEAHACVVGPGYCADASACQLWELCSGGHTCAPQAGRCNVQGDCQAWQICNGSHTCVAGPGYCADASGCQSWETCTGAHTCGPVAGRCNVLADCQSWQVCNGSHTCVAGPGSCADASGCQAWETCTGSHTCAPVAGRCNADANCESWQVCNGSHTCVAGPGYCADASGCQAWEACTNHRCAPQSGRCNGAADCLGFWPSCSASNWCTDAQPAGTDLILQGTLAEGPPGYDALAPISDPRRVRPALNAALYGDAYLRPDGAVLYADTDATWTQWQLREFHQDPWGPGTTIASWFPSTWIPNDTVVPTPGCTPGDPGTRQFVLREGTGELLYGCWGTDSNDDQFFDAAGVPTAPGTNILAWNAAGAKLGTYSTAWVVWDTAGTMRWVTGLPPFRAVLDQRADGDGFLMALDRSPTYELWRVDGAGVASYRGTYAPTPPEAWFEIGSCHGVIDRSGVLFVINTPAPYDITSMVEVIVRHTWNPTPGAATAQIVFSDANAPANANTTGPSTAYIKIHASRLIRGP